MTLLEYLQSTDQDPELFIGAVNARSYYHSRPAEHAKEKGFSLGIFGQEETWYDRDYREGTEEYLKGNPDVDIRSEIEGVRHWIAVQQLRHSPVYKINVDVLPESPFIGGKTSVCALSDYMELAEIWAHPEKYMITTIKVISNARFKTDNIPRWSEIRDRVENDRPKLSAG